MSAKADIFIGLQYRDKLSVGQNRIRLGRRAFHWSIIVAVPGEYHRFDVTDGIVQDPVTFKDINPARNWIYRHNVSHSLSGIPRYLGSVQLNSKPLEVNLDKLARIFDNTPMPDNDGDHSQTNCVTWTTDAVLALQEAGYCQKVDMHQLLEFALTHADKRLADFRNMADPTRYPPNNTRWLRLF